MKRKKNPLALKKVLAKKAKKTPKRTLFSDKGDEEEGTENEPAVKPAVDPEEPTAEEIAVEMEKGKERAASPRFIEIIEGVESHCADDE